MWSELDVDREAERSREEQPVLGADGRARDLELVERVEDTGFDDVTFVSLG